jgi:hypothetical protein
MIAGVLYRWKRLFEPLRYAKSLLATPQRRHAVRWLASRRRDYLLRARVPWITFDAAEFLASRVRPGWRVFEYGSGGSTLFWLKLGCRCVSIEHDPEWFEAVRRRVPPASELDYRLVAPEMASAPRETDLADPEAYVSSDSRYHGCTFRNYVAQIDSFPDESFDMIVIDGRARPSCVVHAKPKVRAGGFVVLDNGDEKHYAAAPQLLQEFTLRQFEGACPFQPFFTRTDIYARPA